MVINGNNEQQMRGVARLVMMLKPVAAKGEDDGQWLYGYYPRSVYVS